MLNEIFTISFVLFFKQNMLLINIEINRNKWIQLRKFKKFRIDLISQINQRQIFEKA